MTGGSGADSLDGGIGIDSFRVDVAQDVVVELTGGGTDLVQSTTLSLNLAAYAFVENATLSGAASLDLTGTVGANMLNGNAGANLLKGLAGNGTVIGGSGEDRLHGDQGNDRLRGGRGADAFVFDTALGAANIDWITDYAVTDDTIVLENAVFAAGALVAGAFVRNTKGLAMDASDRIIFETDTGSLRYDANGSAAGGGTHFATVTQGADSDECRYSGDLRARWP